MMLVVLAGCQPARQGARCRTTQFGDDGGDWVLQCRNGRWQQVATKRDVALALLAAQNSKAAPAPEVPTGVTSAAGSDDYPARLRSARQDSVIDPWGFPNRQCTSFVAWRLASANGYRIAVPLGDASMWDEQFAGYAVVNTTAAVGAIAQWDANESGGGLGAGPLGHVGWVSAVNADGTATVEQYNVGSDGNYLRMDRVRAPRYIHVRDL